MNEVLRNDDFLATKSIIEAKINNKKTRQLFSECFD